MGGAYSVYYEIVALPTGFIGAVGVDVKHHPVGVGVRGNILCGFNIEVKVFGITCHFGKHNVVSARVVCKYIHSADYTCTTGISRLCAALVAEKFRSDIIPL